MFWPWCSVSVGVSGLDAFRDASAMCQLRFSTSNCASHLVGLSDVSKARFQLWLSSHALAMSLRVKLDHSSSMSPEARECANQLSPWFLTLFCDSSFNDQFWTDFRCYWPLRFPTWGPTLLSLFRAQALCFPDSVLRAVVRRFNLSRSVRLGWTLATVIVVLPCRFLALFHSLQRARNKHGRPRVNSSSSVSRLVFHTSMASGMCPKALFRHVLPVGP